MKQAVLLLSLLLAVVAVQAQNKLIFEETKQEAYLMKQGATSNGSQVHLNSILQLLSTAKVNSHGGGRTNRTPEYTVRFEQQARVAHAGDQLQVKVQLTKVSVGGDVFHRGFDLGEVLLPEELKYKARLLNGDKLLKDYSGQQVQLKFNGVTLLDTTFPDTVANQQYKLRVEEKQLNYTAADVRRVQERLDLIKDYYGTEALVVKAAQDAARVLPDDIDRINLHDRKLQELEELYSRLKKTDYKEKLSLKQNDPQRLLANLTKLEQVLLERRNAINYALATLDQQFYNRGVSLLNSGNRSSAQAYFLKSVEANPKFAPSHVQLARLDFINGYLQEAAIRTRDVLMHMRTDRRTTEMALLLAQDIYGTYITMGNSLTSRGTYHEALSAYAEARDFCSTLGGLRCNMPALNYGEARAATGAYRAMVDTGKQLLSRNDLKEAERVAEEALGFQREYDFVLHNDREATELLGQVKFQFYLQHMDQGKRYLSQQQYDAALNQFEIALNMEQRYTLKPVQELGGLAKKAAKPVLLAKLSQGYEQAMQNRLADARAVASAAVAMQERYALQSDGEVQNKYNLLRDRIFTQECNNTQAAYDKHFQNAKGLIAEKKYITADQAYQAAIKAAEEKPECGIATFTATDGRIAIAPAANYQRKLEDISRMVNSRRYAEAIQAYNEAEKLYLANEVNRFGLDHISLYNYAKDHKKQPFTAEVVQHFASIGEEQVAVQLLTALLDKGYSKSKTKKVQQQIGTQLAAKDAARALQQDAKVLSSQYTNNNRNLISLKKAYEKQSKLLAKR